MLGAGIDLLDRDGFCGNHVMDNAEELGIALENVAKENPRIARLLEDGVESMAWINLFLVVAGIVTPIAARHVPLRRRVIVEDFAEDEMPGFAGDESPVMPSEAPIPPTDPTAADISGLPPAGRISRPRTAREQYGNTFPL